MSHERRGIYDVHTANPLNLIEDCTLTLKHSFYGQSRASQSYVCLGSPPFEFPGHAILLQHPDEAVVLGPSFRAYRGASPDPSWIQRLSERERTTCASARQPSSGEAQREQEAVELERGTLCLPLQPRESLKSNEPKFKANITRSKEEAIALLQQYAAEIDGSTSKFAELASAHSDCSSHDHGGDLGWFRPGQMQKPFEDAAYALNVDQISDVLPGMSSAMKLQLQLGREQMRNEPILNSSANERRWFVEPAPIHSSLNLACRPTTSDPCPYELWIALDLDDVAWTRYSKFTFRISWPASYPTEFSIQLYKPHELLSYLNISTAPLLHAETVSPLSSAQTRRRFARIRLVDTGVRAPNSASASAPALVPFVVILEPLYFNVLPASLSPVLVFLAVVAGIAVLIVPSTIRVFERLAERAKVEMHDIKAEDAVLENWNDDSNFQTSADAKQHCVDFGGAHLINAENWTRDFEVESTVCTRIIRSIPAGRDSVAHSCRLNPLRAGCSSALAMLPPSLQGARITADEVGVLTKVSSRCPQGSQHTASRTPQPPPAELSTINRHRDTPPTLAKR
ncbi:hypothetical protein EW146_g5310 [Bondarzewia mesenterica]|uniref:peptidylprolyl isomerase n=1 Tax=Bondarzewia mesenterica TaxID=1095465 RepID=A0A4V3XEW3_9AGAM|nr:hypothetical protein EW146_g5310 [Bondarzewia mesenterica]